LEQLHAEQRSSPQARVLCAELYSKLGWIKFHRGDNFAALRHHLNAMHLLEALAQAQPRSMRILKEFTLSLRSMGQVKIAAGELDEAWFYLSDAQSKFEILVSRTPARADYLVEQLRTVIELKQVAKALGNASGLEALEGKAAQLLGTLEQRAVPKELVGELRERLRGGRES
jgi:hypothetical protein